MVKNGLWWFVLGAAIAFPFVQGAMPVGAVRSRFRAPYRNGRASFPARGLPGVYIIKRDGVTVYVGYSASDVYKALYRHFQQWNDRSRPGERVTYSDPDAYRVRVVYVSTGEQAARLERALILRYRPMDNARKYDAEPFDADARSLVAALDVVPFFASDEPAPF